MAHAMRMIAVTVAALALQGCLAKTAYNVATLPVRAASKGVDLATTSQSEADEKRGREIRQREERLGRLRSLRYLVPHILGALTKKPVP